MNSNPVFGVVSVYNDNPENLLKFFSAGHFIFDNSDSNEELHKGLGPVRLMNNPGHSLCNFLTFIIENYESLPTRLALVKSNVVPRHVESESALAALLARESPQMLWSDSSFQSDYVSQKMDPPNLFMERNTSWYLRDGDTRPRFFGSFDQFERFVFVKPRRKVWVRFSPGACYLVSKENVQAAPKGLYEFLRVVSSYRFFPKEAYLVERILWQVFNPESLVQPRFNNGEWRADLEQITPFGVSLASSLSRIEALVHVLKHRRH